MGSPDFALPTLRALIAGEYTPVVVVTQPDRPAGRGRVLRPPPVKPLAEAAGIPVLQPERLRDPDALAALAAYAPQFQVICAYGQILSRDVLALPSHGTLNVHASLLPRWRGAAPAAAAIRAGDHESGVTIMLVDEGLDTGPILAQRAEPIREEDDTGRLNQRLAEVGAALLMDTIPGWLAGKIAPQPQDPTHATSAPRLKKGDGRIDWSRSAVEIWRQVRASAPWPGATTTLGGKALRVWRARPEGTGSGAPGAVLTVGDGIAVQTGAGVLHLLEVQREGRRPLPAPAFARGDRDLVGRRFD